MAIKNLSLSNIQPRLADYGARDYVKTSADVANIRDARYKLLAKVQNLSKNTTSEDVKQVLKFTAEIIMDEIQALMMLQEAKARLEEPHVAAWIALNDKVERLSEELDRVTRRIPEDATYG